jgi:hypothetical protein
VNSCVFALFLVCCGSRIRCYQDSANSRVLYFPSGSTTALKVYGQHGSFVTNIANTLGISASSLNVPHTVALWGSALGMEDGMYIADYSNSRMLFYEDGSTTARFAMGQGL